MNVQFGARIFIPIEEEGYASDLIKLRDGNKSDIATFNFQEVTDKAQISARCFRNQNGIADPNAEQVATTLANQIENLWVSGRRPAEDKLYIARVTNPMRREGAESIAVAAVPRSKHHWARPFFFNFNAFKAWQAVQQYIDRNLNGTTLQT